MFTIEASPAVKSKDRTYLFLECFLLHRGEAVQLVISHLPVLQSYARESFDVEQVLCHTVTKEGRNKLRVPEAEV